MMAANPEFYHSLAVDKELCLGCAHCIRRCPTKALRIRDGKAAIRKNWCIDCGQCLKVCPVSAIYVEQDDFGAIFDYTHRVAIVPASFLGQFPETDDEEKLFGALRSLGFTHIYPAELTVEVVRRHMAAQIAANTHKPAISSFCPAVVRLIQTKFPDLLDHILNLRMPVETTAMLVRRRLEKAGAYPSQIGIFYVTPCAAKAASIREGEPRLIDGILNLNSLYNKACHILRNKKGAATDHPTPPVPVVTQQAIRWSMTGGEAAGFPGRCFAVDGIDHVAEFLERLETTGEIHQIDFLELRACNCSCMGGALTPANRFLAEERLRNRTATHPRRAGVDGRITPSEKRFLAADIVAEKPVPMTKLVYQGEIEEVLSQMDRARQIERSLPGIDCGACGSPTCRSLSNDIVRGEAVRENCIFMQLAGARDGVVDTAHVRRLLDEVWGRAHFEKGTNK